MRVTVDEETCIGCGLCPDICPEVFRMTGDKAEAYKDPVPEELEDAVREASEGCPVDAIPITEVIEK